MTTRACRPIRLSRLATRRPTTLGSLRTLASGTQDARKKAWSATLLLPSTTLPLKHKDPVAAEQKYRQKITDELYRRQWARENASTKVLHDGPPYANGHLHMGHALNKILKDIINRYNVMRGHRVHYVPGWDCHGLPIEQKALLEAGGSHTTMTPSEVRSRARETATTAIQMQKDEFKSLAIMADWEAHDGVYITMDSAFEIRQLRLFQNMVEEGHITYRLRPTYYSPSSRTALAESELSYKDGHKSRSVYVGFPVAAADMSEGLRLAYHQAITSVGELPLKLAVWTTTAWTLPANAGVNIGADMSYVVALASDQSLLVLAEARLGPMQDVVGPLRVVAQLSGADLVGTRYSHAFHPQHEPAQRPTVFASTHVTSESGTGLVHSAPSHGYDDYVAFSTAGLLPEELRCPVDDDGCFTDEVVKWSCSDLARNLVGKSVLGEGVSAVIDLLHAQGTLLAEETIEHRYPYDWKTKEPVIVRATPQWFADVEAIKARATKALEKVDFYPPQSRNRLEAFVTSRSEWCISRQRSWGVPIPALYTETGQPIVESATISHIIQVLQGQGTDYWWSGPMEDFVPAHRKGEVLTRGTDTLDVWFDSGSSWTLLAEKRIRPVEQEPLSDVYLEGSDQHRGWFQSSLLTALGVRSTATRAPYRNIVSHGFVMDEEGQKMSKSAGNGLSPVEVASGSNDRPGLGADTLRLWAASVDYTKDVSIGPSALSHASETLRKIRSATRFLLANSASSLVPDMRSAKLSLLDQFVLHELSQLEYQAIDAYDNFAFNRVVQSTTTFLSSTLSSLYFDAIKDTLYCSQQDHEDRLAIVATVREISRTLRKIIAPIIPHLAQELSDHDNHCDDASVFDDTWMPEADWRNDTVIKDASTLLLLRSSVNKLLESVRSDLGVKSADEVVLIVNADKRGLSELERLKPSLPLFLGCSEVKLADAPALGEEETILELPELGQVRISMKRTSRHKCGRCWKHRAVDVDSLCGRCARVVGR